MDIFFNLRFMRKPKKRISETFQYICFDFIEIMRFDKSNNYILMSRITYLDSVEHTKI